MSRGESDAIPPPKAGDPISARYLLQEHRRSRRNGVVPSGSLSAIPGPGGTALLLRTPGFALALTTSTITAATYDGSNNITAFGSGTCNGYVCTGSAADVDSDRGRTVYQVGTSTIASGTVVLLYPLFGEAAGMFVLGKVC